MKQALVTGATGFVGSGLARRLVEDGWRVHALVRPSSSLDRLAAVKDEIEVVADPGDVEGLTERLADIELDAVFHLAAHFVGQHAPADIVPLVNANVGLPARLAEAVSATGREGLVFVNTGTAWQHAEGEPYNPVALYAAMKQAAADVLRFYADAGAFRLVHVAIYDTYGPDDPRPKLLNMLRRVQAEGTPLAMSSGQQLIDLVYIDDVADAFLAAAAAGEHLAEYAVTSGAPVSLRGLVDAVERVTGEPVPVEWGARPDRAKEMREHWQFAPAVPGWSPKVSLEEGIKRVWAA